MYFTSWYKLSYFIYYLEQNNKLTSHFTWSPNHHGSFNSIRHKRSHNKYYATNYKNRINGLETGCSVFNLFKTQFCHALLDKGMGIQRQKYWTCFPYYCLYIWRISYFCVKKLQKREIFVFLKGVEMDVKKSKMLCWFQIWSNISEKLHPSETQKNTRWMYLKGLGSSPN